MCKKLVLFAVLIVVLSVIPCDVFADANPVCWWKFDGNASDSSAYARDGTENGGPTYVKTDISGQDQYSGIFNSDSSTVDFQLDVDGAENYRYHGGSSVPLGPVSTDWVHLAATCDGRDVRRFRYRPVLQRRAGHKRSGGGYRVRTICRWRQQEYNQLFRRYGR